MVRVLDVDPQLLERQHRLAAHVRACVQRGQVEVAALVEHLGGARVAEQVVLELGADVEGVEAHRARSLQRASQDVAGIALIGGALGRDHVAEHAPHALGLGPPRQHGEGRWVGHRDHVRLLDRVEARYRGAVEAHPRFERVVEFLDVDREGLQPAQDVGEPEADEADLALGHDGLDVLRGLGELGHRRDLSPALRCPLWTPGQRAAAAASPQWPATLATKSATSSASLPW